MAKKAKKRGGWTKAQRANYKAAIAARKGGKFTIPPGTKPTAGTHFTSAMIPPKGMATPKDLMVLDGDKLTLYRLNTGPVYLKV